MHSGLSVDQNAIYLLLYNMVIAEGTLDKALMAAGPWLVNNKPKDIEAAVSKIKNDLSAVFYGKNPPTIKPQAVGPWFPGPNENSTYWNGFEKSIAKEGWEGDRLAEIRNIITKTVNLMPPVSEAQDFSSRGLVVGYVQSGKTTNFMGLAAMAADLHYQLIIVLSGVTNNLREQTQYRLENILSSDTAPWHWLTSEGRDFKRAYVKANTELILNTKTQRAIAVIKKNSTRLQQLITWLEKDANEATRKNLKVLVIDDECDQASLNTGNVNEYSKIHAKLLKLLDPAFLPKTTYVGYSATPFANVLSEAAEEKSLYPKDFIVSLDSGEGYFGAEQLFGRSAIDENDEPVDGMDLIRTIPIDTPDDEKKILGKAAGGKGAPSDIPFQLKKSIHWFFCATSQRKLRSGKDDFSTMLIHTSPSIAAHESMEKLVKSYVEHLQLLEKEQVRELFKETWTEELQRFPLKEEQHSVELILETAWEKLQKVKVIVDNSKSRDRLNYERDSEGKPVDADKPVVVIGGGTLSRGLTLEGLISTYFLRTTLNYAALLQMGRWFGYRKGYDDLQRIWMPIAAQGFFYFLATVEEEVRSQIATYALDGTTPRDVGMKIRKHPKMRAATEAQLRWAKDSKQGFAEIRAETIVLPAQKQVLDSNMQSVKEFVAELVNEYGNPQESYFNSNWKMFCGVSSDYIAEFLAKYQFAPKVSRIACKPLTQYIYDRVTDKANPELQKWNIALFSKESGKPVHLTNDIKVGTIERSRRLNEKDETINIHHLVSKTDNWADLSEVAAKVENRPLKNAKNDYSPSVILEHRENFNGDDSLSGVGLLGIYVVDAKGKSKVDSKVSIDLDEDAVGLCLFFPTSKSVTAKYSYFEPNLDDFIVGDEEFEQDINEEIAEIEAANVEDETQVIHDV